MVSTENCQTRYVGSLLYALKIVRVYTIFVLGLVPQFGFPGEIDKDGTFFESLRDHSDAYAASIAGNK